MKQLSNRFAHPTQAVAARRDPTNFEQHALAKAVNSLRIGKKYHTLTLILSLICAGASIADDRIDAEILANKIEMLSTTTTETSQLMIDGCSLSFDISYDGQCKAGSVVGLSGKSIHIDLYEFDFEKTIQQRNRDGSAFIQFVPRPSVSDKYRNAREFQLKLSLSPTRDDFSKSQAMQLFLDGVGLRSYVTMKRCDGSTSTTLVGRPEMRLTVVGHDADQFAGYISEYKQRYCEIK